TFLYAGAVLRDLHSFPTRRSSDLEACAEHGLEAPRIVTECGRAMTAHHAVLVANVTEVEEAPEGRVPPAHDDEPAVIRRLREVRSEEHTSELQSRENLVCRLLLEK